MKMVSSFVANMEHVREAEAATGAAILGGGNL